VTCSRQGFTVAQALRLLRNPEGLRPLARQFFSGAFAKRFGPFFGQLQHPVRSSIAPHAFRVRLAVLNLRDRAKDPDRAPAPWNSASRWRPTANDITQVVVQHRIHRKRALRAFHSGLRPLRSASQRSKHPTREIDILPRSPGWLRRRAHHVQRLVQIAEPCSTKTEYPR